MGRDRTPPALPRRRFLQLGAATLAACGKADPGSTDTGPDPAGTCEPGAPTDAPDPSEARTASLPADPFTLGVASGDPLHDRVVLWTRLVLEPTDVAGMPGDDIDVVWELYADASGTTLLQTGVATAQAAHGHSVHVDVDGLESATDHFYRFRVEGPDGAWESPLGRTRTLPCDDAALDRFRVGFATCQNWLVGYYPGYRHMADQQLDLVIHLGDYIYEGGDRGPVRDHGASEPSTLDEYRDRYGLYRSDPDLQAAHASAPWILTQDDHEVDNNYAGTEWRNGGAAEARMTAAMQAWWEHCPTRSPRPTGPAVEVRRSLHVGDLLQVILLESRQERDPQPCDDRIGSRCDETDDDRTMLGADQEAWLEQALTDGAAAWIALASPVVMLPMDFGGSFLNPDQWDGYPQARQRLLDAVSTHGSGDLVVFSGDIHSTAWGWIPVDPLDLESGPTAAEIVVTPMSSGVTDETFLAAAPLLARQPHIDYWDLAQRGWVEADFGRTQLTVRCWQARDNTDPASAIDPGPVVVVTAGDPVPQRTDT